MFVCTGFEKLRNDIKDNAEKKTISGECLFCGQRCCVNISSMLLQMSETRIVAIVDAYMAYYCTSFFLDLKKAPR